MQFSAFNRNDIMENMAKHSTTTTTTLSLSLDKASILQRIKEGYLIWMNVTPHIQKGARYTIGARIENKFLDLLELAYITYFTGKEKKAKKLQNVFFFWIR